MVKKYLLTYDKEIKVLGVVQYTLKTYEWFEDVDEMSDFIEDNDIKPTEMLYIDNAEVFKEVE